MALPRARQWLGTALGVLSAAAVLGACTFPVRFATPEEVAQATHPTPPPATSGGSVAPPPAVGGLDQLQADLRRLIAQVGPSVVRVETSTASGSGLLLDSAGTVVTPASLVAGSQQATVTTAAGQQYAGTVTGSDPSSDVAVIRITGASGLTAVTLGDSGAVQLGDVVVVVGNQLTKSASVSQGIVSATAATVTAGTVTLTGLMRITAPMAAGTAGSAVVNTAGQVIGMTTLGGSGSPGLGVAIPSNQVSSTAQKLLAGGAGPQAGTAYLGVTVTDAAGGGALVQSVVAGSPAAVAGLRAGTTIVGIGSQSVPNAAAIAQILAGYSPGQRVVVTVKLSTGATQTIPVVLGTA